MTTTARSRRLVQAALAWSLLIGLAAPAVADAPTNDDFEDRIDLLDGVEQWADMREATVEAGEALCPLMAPPGSNSAGPTAYWRFTPVEAGTYTAYATGGNYDTEIAYATAVDTFHPDTTCPDDANDSYDAVEAPITLEADEDVWIQLAGNSFEDRGSAGIGVTRTYPGEDAFADRRTVPFAEGSEVAVVGVTLTGTETTEADEPLGCGTATTDQTVWASFTPTTSEVWMIEAKFDASVDLAVFEGSALDSLNQIGCSTSNRIAVALDLTAGTTYAIQVGRTGATPTNGIIRAEPAGMFRSLATVIDLDGDGTSPFPGDTSAATLLADGRPAVSYGDAINGELRYAERAADGTWSDVLVDADGDGTSTVVGEFSDIAVLPDGRPVIAYYDVENDELRFAERSAGGVWSDVLVDADGDGTSSAVGDGLSLAILPDGRPAIAYYDDDNEELRYAERSAGGVWSDILVDADGDGTSTDVGSEMSMVVYAGQPAIAYVDDDNDEMRLATRPGGTWSESLIRGVEALTPSNDGPEFYNGANGRPDLVIGPDGMPRLAVQDADSGHAWYAALSGGDWEIEEVLTNRFLAELGDYSWIELNFDRNGDPVIIWEDDYNSYTIGVSAWKDGAWHEQIPVPFLFDPTDPTSEGRSANGVARFGSVVLPDGRIAYTSHDEEHGGLYWVEDVYRTCSEALTPLVDVPESSYAADDVRCIYEIGITTGTSGTTYSPAENVTREQMASFLARTYRAMTGDDCTGGSTPFTDVPATSFAVTDIACIYDLGITTGTSGTTYSPYDSVTREQMASFLARLYRLVTDPGCSGGSTPFTDVPATSFAVNDIPCIYGLGITTGTSATTYSPGDLVTREQMAAFLGRTWRAPAIVD